MFLSARIPCTSSSLLPLGLLLPLEDAKYEEQVVKGVRDRSVQLLCGDVVLPMVVFWSFTKLGSLIPRAVAISNGLESKVEKAAAVLGDVTLKNSTLEIENLQMAAEGRFMCQALYEEGEETKAVYYYIELIVLGKSMHLGSKVGGEFILAVRGRVVYLSG